MRILSKDRRERKKGKKAFFIERLRFSSEDRGEGGMTQFPSNYREKKKKISLKDRGYKKQNFPKDGDLDTES